MGKRSKPAESPADLLKRKKNKLDWDTFNFLENMLVFCLEPSLSVRAESGVKFSISRQAGRDSLCLLFKIDRAKDELVRERGHPRPDYLAFYKSADLCLFTIIEMKGRTENALEHGLDQLLTFKARLQTEFNAHFPLFASATFQAILIHPPNAQVPQKKIQAEADKGFVILPVKSDHDTELWPYVTKKNRLTERYQRQKLTPSENVSWIEKALNNNALPKRIEDSWYKANRRPGDGSGVYITYLLSDKGGYATLTRNESKYVVVVKEEGEKHRRDIAAFLVDVRLSSKFILHKL